VIRTLIAAYHFRVFILFWKKAGHGIFFLDKDHNMYSGLFAAALIAFILTAVSVFFLRRRGPWGSIWTFFLVLFLALCTVSIYLAPIGPVYWGIAWFPMMVAGIIITILLIAAMPHPTERPDTAIGDQVDTTGADIKSHFPVTPVGRFFWALIILFVIAIVVGIANPQRAL
jgi:hypothetical protein